MQIFAPLGAKSPSTVGGLLQYMALQDQWDYTLRILSLEQHAVLLVGSRQLQFLC